MFRLDVPAPWKSIFLPLISVFSTGILCASLTQTFQDHTSEPQQDSWLNKQGKNICIGIHVYVHVKRETQTFLFAHGLYKKFIWATNISKHL